MNEPLVIHDTIDDEVLVIRNDTGTYHSMLGAAADIWTAVTAGLPRDAIVALLSSRYAAEHRDLEAATDGFLAELLEAQLLREVVGESSGGAPAPELPGPLHPRATFSAPTLESYNDVADLLLFDPIHEVTPDGWPNVPDAGS